MSVAVTFSDSEAFSRWFGGSRIVDSQGRPLVVYHGTRESFTVFRARVGGAHFGTKEQACNRTFGKGTLMPVYLSIKNPVRVPDLNVWGAYNVAEALQQAGRLCAAEVAAVMAAGSRTPAWAALRGILAEKGIDGFVYANGQEGRGDSYIALDPGQIKSVYNRGTFDPADADITR